MLQVITIIVALKFIRGKLKKMKQTKMWSSLLSFHGTCVLLLLTLVSTNDGFGVEAVKDFKVGDEFGWQEPGHNNTATYSQWATRNRFHVGDSLGKLFFYFFKY